MHETFQVSRLLFTPLELEREFLLGSPRTRPCLWFHLPVSLVLLTRHLQVDGVRGGPSLSFPRESGRLFRPVRSTSCPVGSTLTSLTPSDLFGSTPLSWDFSFLDRLTLFCPFLARRFPRRPRRSPS